jgi:ribosome-binding protein aMBF1 (putative translation factor)
MSSSVNQSMGAAHRLLHELPPPPMAKATSRKLNSDFQADIGGCIARARLLVGWSKKELAAAVERDDAQISRWEAGKERPQFDALWSVPAFRAPFVIALAELAKDGIEISTEIRIRRTA